MILPPLSASTESPVLGIMIDMRHEACPLGATVPATDVLLRSLFSCEECHHVSFIERFMHPALFVVVLIGLAPLASRLAAQEPAPPVRPWAFNATFGMRSTPDAFSSRCGRGSSGSIGRELGGSLLRRIGSHLIVETTTRVLATQIDAGCTLSIPIVRIDSETYETRPGATYPSSTPSAPFATSMLRTGLTLGNERVGARMLLGGGLVWSNHLLP